MLIDEAQRRTTVAYAGLEDNDWNTEMKDIDWDAAVEDIQVGDVPVEQIENAHMQDGAE